MGVGGCGWDGSGGDWSVGVRDFDGEARRHVVFSLWQLNGCATLILLLYRRCIVWGVDVAWSAIEVPHDELFKMLVNFLLLISFLDEHFVQICRRFNEEFRFGADLTVPM